MIAPKPLNTTEAAERLGLSAGYLVKMRVKGGGPAYRKLGARRVVYAQADLDAWFDAQRRTSTSDAGEVRL